MYKCTKCGGYFTESDSAWALICEGKDVLMICPHCSDASRVIGANKGIYGDSETYEMYSYNYTEGVDYRYREVGKSVGNFKLIHRVETPDKTEAIELWDNGEKKEIRQFYTNNYGVYKFCGNLSNKFDFFNYWIEEWRKHTDYYKENFL